MRKPTKKETKLLFSIIGQHLKRHSILLIIVLSIILLANVVITLGWNLSPDYAPTEDEIAFYVVESVMILITVVTIVSLIFVRLGKIKDTTLAIFSHVYAAFLIAWATIIFYLDISVGFTTLLYLIIATFVAGVFVIDPFYFAALELVSLIPIAITIAKDRRIFFGNIFFEENITLFAIFIVLIIAVCFRNHRVIYSEYKIEKRLEELSYRDELTGLLNERSYIDIVENIDNRIDEGKEVKFAVILMDVNNLKATNDAFGHRYGCSLVVRCGHTLPTLFKSSKLFHIGGDEFVAIVMGEDLENFEKTMKRFDEAMLYSIVKYEDKELVFSVARGFHIKEEGQHYKDVLQIADNKMYENKKYLKEKYNMKGR